jgi:hypothetical protein
MSDRVVLPTMTSTALVAQQLGWPVTASIVCPAVPRSSDEPPKRETEESP